MCKFIFWVQVIAILKKMAEMNVVYYGLDPCINCTPNLHLYVAHVPEKTLIKLPRSSGSWLCPAMEVIKGQYHTVTFGWIKDHHVHHLIHLPGLYPTSASTKLGQAQPRRTPTPYRKPVWMRPGLGGPVQQEVSRSLGCFCPTLNAITIIITFSSSNTNTINWNWDKILDQFNLSKQKG